MLGVVRVLFTSAARRTAVDGVARRSASPPAPRRALRTQHELLDGFSNGRIPCAHATDDELVTSPASVAEICSMRARGGLCEVTPAIGRARRTSAAAAATSGARRQYPAASAGERARNAPDRRSRRTPPRSSISHRNPRARRTGRQPSPTRRAHARR
ncbi:hypothetical protein EVAR_31678_1 [Eumeta japonica]|uniref:Uncharacterized protein n=1 Tax=Eumeta variegata TaxID=151549 RepID=A0A4C1VVP0_EUMVA|nr:hypothetical protein EVAR_31678_1 [Eumeta japonica]